jgi:phosphoribulokinase
MTRERAARQPIVLGIMGDSGSGKTTLTSVVSLLGADRVTDLCLDDYHKYDRAGRSRRAITAIHPDCNDLGLMQQHLTLLRRGETVYKPVYDHRTGTFAEPEFLTPREFVIAHGLLGYHTDALRGCYDLCVFLDPDAELRVAWKLQRDTSRRGYTPEEVRRQLEHRRLDAERFIRPQLERADVVVAFFPRPGARDVRDGAHLSVRITVRHPLAGVDRAALGRRDRGARTTGARGAAHVTLEESRGRENEYVIEMDGQISDEQTADIASGLRRALSPPEGDRFGSIGTFVEGDAVRRSNVLALTQLLITVLLLHSSAQSRERVPTPSLTP